MKLFVTVQGGRSLACDKDSDDCGVLVYGDSFGAVQVICIKPHPPVVGSWANGLGLWFRIQRAGVEVHFQTLSTCHSLTLGLSESVQIVITG